MLSGGFKCDHTLESSESSLGASTLKASTRQFWSTSRCSSMNETTPSHDSSHFQNSETFSYNNQEEHNSMLKCWSASRSERQLRFQTKICTGKDCVRRKLSTTRKSVKLECANSIESGSANKKDQRRMTVNRCELAWPERNSSAAHFFARHRTKGKSRCRLARGLQPKQRRILACLAEHNQWCRQ